MTANLWLDVPSGWLPNGLNEGEVTAWECQVCGALVGDMDLHERFHRAMSPGRLMPGEEIVSAAKVRGGAIS